MTKISEVSATNSWMENKNNFDRGLTRDDIQVAIEYYFQCMKPDGKVGEIDIKETKEKDINGDGLKKTIESLLLLNKPEVKVGGETKGKVDVQAAIKSIFSLSNEMVSRQQNPDALVRFCVLINYYTIMSSLVRVHIPLYVCLSRLLMFSILNSTSILNRSLMRSARALPPAGAPQHTLR